MKEVEFIKKKAFSLGACSLLKPEATIYDLDNLLWHPQGWEFCAKHGFPSLNSLVGLDDEGYRGILVNAGDVQSYAYRTAAAGDTNITLVADNVREKYDVILFHGASLVIEASNYSVIHVVCVGACTMSFNNIDGTARLLK